MKYYIIAGEASGDLHGANLLKALFKAEPNAEVRFWGGDLMEQVGGTLVKHYKDLAFMGFAEVVMNLRTIFQNIDFCKKDIQAFNPDVIIFIDYPGFNMQIAKWAKKKGFLSGTQSHLHYLPEGHTDFIIAAFSEEFGFISIIILMLLYFAIIIRTMQISMYSLDNYGKLLSGGLGLAFFVYVFVNAGMVSGILPVTGIPLPFMSYGGTAIITLMASFGIVMSIYTHR